MNVGSIYNKKSEKNLLVDTNLIKIDKKYLVNNYVKLSILSVLSGYKQCDHIYVDDKFDHIDLKKLGSFISYILNHDIAPKKFNIKISQNKNILQKKKIIKLNDYNSILCFSGGIDSTAGLLYALNRKEHVLPMWVDFGQRNNISERESIQKVLSRMQIPLFTVKINLNKFILDGWKEWGFIIPGRNFLFLSLANAYLQHSQKRKNRIYLCAHKDEMGYLKNRDKSRYFFKSSSNFFSNNERDIIATTPFGSYSKSEIISYWRQNWENKFNISPYDTTTCYYESGCGKCEACLKRAIYLIAGGYKINSKYKINPLKDPSGFMVKKWMPNIINNRISRSNKLDFLIAVEENISIVPKKISEFFKKLPKQTLAAISRRRKEIALIKLE